ncbi:MAG: hypothetical protein HETSPECPRED_001647 [Heterodermia speciosa]|uniref:Uncharacterized protein n=1 Tax=Heterodermia speciosa TaxID=116794 RepID=A0A8H3F0K5_9LECA|nr:MAG: hypothetical protein HETSPECPRED_001647 [Heterodermia speciosa]
MGVVEEMKSELKIMDENATEEPPLERQDCLEQAKPFSDYQNRDFRVTESGTRVGVTG